MRSTAPIASLLLAALFGVLCACDHTPPAPATTASASAAATPSSDLSPPDASTPPAVAAPKRNVLLITIDALRSDRMPWSDYRHDVMPNVAAFAKKSVVYSRFYALSSYTSMSFAGLLAARYPSEIQRSGYFFSATPDEVLLFPEVLQKAGVVTLSAQAHWYFQAEKARLHQGFDVWQMVPGLKKSNKTDENVTSPQHLALALKQLGDPAHTGPGKQFFAWYHFMDPHDQYVPNEKTASFGGGANALYDGELYFTDQHIGKLLDFVDSQPFGQRTVVIVSSDHGESFGLHKMYRHGFELWEELVQVPLIIRVPGVEPRQIDEPRGSIDLPATIMELMEVKPDPLFRGTSLVAELRGKEPQPRPVITDLPRTSDNDRRRALIDGHYKLIAIGDDDELKLFDLSKDPREMHNIAGKDKQQFERMKRLYEQLSKDIKDVCPKIRKLKGKKKGKPC